MSPAAVPVAGLVRLAAVRAAPQYADVRSGLVTGTGIVQHGPLQVSSQGCESHYGWGLATGYN